MSHLVATYGYYAVAAFVFIECLGIPLPGETILIAAGIYAGQSHKLSVTVLWIVAGAAAVLGDNLGYEIGRTGGYALLRRYGHVVRVNERELKVGRYLFDRRGAPVVFFGRFVSVLRTYAAFLAGVNRMHWRTFAVANALGGILWAGVYTEVSYRAGDAFTRLSKTLNYVLAALAVVVIIGMILLVRQQIGRLAERAEAAYPGPLE